MIDVAQSTFRRREMACFLHSPRLRRRPLREVCHLLWSATCPERSLLPNVSSGGDTQRKYYEETDDSARGRDLGAFKRHRFRAEPGAKPSTKPGTRPSTNEPAKASDLRPSRSARNWTDRRAEQHQSTGRRRRSGLSDAARGPGARRGAQYATPKPQTIGKECNAKPRLGWRGFRFGRTSPSHFRSGLLPAPAFRECRHSCLARRLVAERRAGYAPLWPLAHIHGRSCGAPGDRKMRPTTTPSSSTL
jgi:hypothetical protein